MRKIDRFDNYMNIKGLNDNKVTVQLGLTIGVIGKSRKEGRDLSDASIEKILNFYTDINRVWLLTGEGEMLQSEKKVENISTRTEDVVMSREVFNQINTMLETISSQQRTIEILSKSQAVKVALEDDNAICAAANE